MPENPVIGILGLVGRRQEMWRPPRPQRLRGKAGNFRLAQGASGTPVYPFWTAEMGQKVESREARLFWLHRPLGTSVSSAFILQLRLRFKAAGGYPLLHPPDWGAPLLLCHSQPGLGPGSRDQVTFHLTLGPWKPEPLTSRRAGQLWGACTGQFAGWWSRTLGLFLQGMASTSFPPKVN